MKFLISILLIFFQPFANSTAQVPSAYQVATWYHFKNAAISYTFDDNTPKQLPVAVPLFDKYHFNVTLFTVTGWGPNWSGLKSAASKGHEIASHTVTHTDLSTLDLAQQQTELQQSQSVINANITNARCLTIAYPYCNPGNLVEDQEYYIAGRVCSGFVEGSNPSNLYSVSSIILGSLGSAKTATGINSFANSAKSSGGWCVFLIHGIDDDGGYSPLSSSELASHLVYVNSDSSAFWVTTFGNAVRYIRERNSIIITDSVISADTIQLSLNNKLDNSIYNQPLTFKRLLAPGWTSAKLIMDKAPIPCTIQTSGNKKYLVFDAVPNQGNILIINDLTSSVNTITNDQKHELKLRPNPFNNRLTLSLGGQFTYAVYSTAGKLIENGKGNNSAELGDNLPAGIFLLKVNSGNVFYTEKIIRN